MIISKSHFSRLNKENMRKNLIARTELEKNQLLKLLNSVESNNLDFIKKLNDNGVPNLINYIDLKEGKTALIKAIELHNEELVGELIKLGADPAVPDLNLKTPLMYACELGFHLIVEKLCKFTIDVNKIDNSHNTALMYCLSSTKRHMKCMEILLQNSTIDINLETEKGTVFLEACKSNLESMALFLITKGANMNVYDTKTKNHAIHYAAKHGKMNLCYILLLNKIDVNVLNSKLQTPTIYAAKFGHLEILKLLFSLGANFDLVDSEGFNAIYYAVARKKGIMVKYLASRGTNPSFKNSQGLTPRKLAKLVKLKRRKRIFKDAEKLYDDWKSKFLHLALETAANTLSFSLDSVRERLNWLLRIYEFIKINKVRLEEILNDKALTENNNVITKESLIDLFKTYISDKIPNLVLEQLFSIFTKNQNLNLVEIKNILRPDDILKVLNLKLSEKKKKRKKRKKLKIHKIRKTKVKVFIPTKNLTQIKDSKLKTKENHFQKIRILREYSKTFLDKENFLQDDTNWFRDEYERTTVELANLINSGNVDSFNDLIQRQKSPDLSQKLLNMKDRFYKSPLTIAIQKNDLKMINYLFSKNVEVNSTDNFKWTPLHHASFLGNTEIALELIKRGANINSKSVTGATPLMLAVKTNDQKMFDLLLKNKALLFDPANLKNETSLEIAKKFASGTKIYDIIKKESEKVKKRRSYRAHYFRRNMKNAENSKKMLPVRISFVKQKAKLIRDDENLRLKKVKSDCAKIKLLLQIPKSEDVNQKEIAVKNRRIHGFQYDFPDFKTLWQKNVERILS